MQHQLRLAFRALLNGSTGDDVQSLKLGHGSSERLSKLTHWATVSPLFLEPVARITLHWVGCSAYKSLQRLRPILTAPNLQAGVPIQVGIFAVAEHRNPSRV